MVTILIFKWEFIWLLVLDLEIETPDRDVFMLEMIYVAEFFPKKSCKPTNKLLNLNHLSTTEDS